MTAGGGVSKALRAYPTYKDSGVPWVGQIPDDWRITGVKTEYAIQLGKMLQPVAGSPSDTEVQYLRSASIQASKISLEDIKTMWMNSAEIEKYNVLAGDLLVVEGGDIGRSALVTDKEEGLKIQNSVHRIRTREQSSNLFLHYVLQHTKDAGYLDVICNKATIQHLTGDKIANLPIPLPNPEEQQAITAFLDRETARIDELLLEQEGLLEDLKIRRQTISSAAVTGTLVPQTAEMRIVENIGSIPEHWEVWKLKRLADVRSGVTKGRDFKGQAVREVPYLRVANVQDGYLDLENVATILIGADELERYALQPGDVLMNEGGDNDKLGRGAVWRGEVSPCVHQNHVFSVRPHAVESEWLALINTSDYAKFFFFVNSKQSTNLASISSSTIKELPVIVPPQNERLAILAEVEKQHTQLDQLVSEVRASMELMRQHRSALITAAVTGKIDVRGTHVPSPVGPG